MDGLSERLRDGAKPKLRLAVQGKTRPPLPVSCQGIGAHTHRPNQQPALAVATLHGVPLAFPMLAFGALGVTAGPGP
eukprot:scaffold4971_cov94-Isochrysis_galbana.AAC.1